MNYEVVRPKRFLVNIYQKLSIFGLFNYFLSYPPNPDCKSFVILLVWYLLFAQEAFSKPSIYMYLTTRFHVAVYLFNNRSQMTSKCGKNKKVAHEA